MSALLRKAAPLAKRREPPSLYVRSPVPEAPRARMIGRGVENESLLRIGIEDSAWGDLYHHALRLPWLQFLAASTGVYLLLNLLFALLYMIAPAGITEFRPGSFADAFFFSIQTSATIGYGRWSPVSTYDNLVVTVETIVCTGTLAVFTGLTFARFARPTAHIWFSRVMVVSDYDGTPSLMVRLANQRANQILDANVSVTLVRDETTAEGQYVRRLRDLPLIRSRSPVFRMTFQAVHPLDETSPLYGCTRQELEQVHAEIVVVVSGLDDTSMQMVHGRCSYDASEVRFGHRFADIFGYTAQGRMALDYRRFHDTVPL